MDNDDILDSIMELTYWELM